MTTSIQRPLGYVPIVVETTSIQKPGPNDIVVACRIFATGMFQTSSNCYDRAVLLWSMPIVLATALPNKEGSWVFKVLLQRFCQTLYILASIAHAQESCLSLVQNHTIIKSVIIILSCCSYILLLILKY